MFLLSALVLSIIGLHQIEATFQGEEKPSKARSLLKRQLLEGSSCEDSPFPFKIVRPNEKHSSFKDCPWVGNKASKRCEMKGVSLMCAKTCDKCNEFKESSLTFKFMVKNDKWRRGTCKGYVAKKKEKRCQIPGMRDTCRETCSSLTSWTWHQIGDDIDGESAGDYFGSSVALSDDGSVVAVGAESNDGSSYNSGHVRIYQNMNGSWEQIGDDIDGENRCDRSGWASALALSGDGNVVAIGAPHNDGNGGSSGHVRVYQNMNGSWEQIGDDIDGESAGDMSGASVALSDDGSVLAVGAYGNDGNNGHVTGHVRVYHYEKGTWNQIGDDIDGENDIDQSGWSIALSDDGSVLAIGAPTNDDNGANTGHLRVYQNVNRFWNQIGDDIDGDSAHGNYGWSIALSGDGGILAVVGRRVSEPVRIYQNMNGSWEQIGEDIDGGSTGDYARQSVALSDDGSVLAVGDPDDYYNGLVRVYKNVKGSWEQIGNDIEGESANDASGWSVALSDDGSVLSIGAPYNDGNGSNSGHVRIFKLDKSD